MNTPTQQAILNAVHTWRKSEFDATARLISGKTDRLDSESSDHILHHLRILADTDGREYAKAICPHCHKDLLR